MPEHNEDDAVSSSDGFIGGPSLPSEIVSTTPPEVEAAEEMENFRLPLVPDVSVPGEDIGRAILHAPLLLAATFLFLAIGIGAFNNPLFELFGFVGCWMAFRRIRRLILSRRQLDCGGLIGFWWSLLCYLGVLSISVILILDLLRRMRAASR
jgi:hypothetical protein